MPGRSRIESLAPGPLLTLIGRMGNIGPETARDGGPVMSSEVASGVDLEEANRQLEGATPREVLRWSVETFFPKLTMATAFGPEGCVILHMLAEVGPRVR